MSVRGRTQGLYHKSRITSCVFDGRKLLINLHVENPPYDKTFLLCANKKTYTLYSHYALNFHPHPGAYQIYIYIYPGGVEYGFGNVLENTFQVMRHGKGHHEDEKCSIVGFRLWILWVLQQQVEQQLAILQVCSNTFSLISLSL